MEKSWEQKKGEEHYLNIWFWSTEKRFGDLGMMKRREKINRGKEIKGEENKKNRNEGRRGKKITKEWKELREIKSEKVFVGEMKSLDWLEPEMR